MIKAEQIRKITNKVNQERQKIALSFIKSEWEAFIEPRIEDAAKNGRCSIAYFWSKEIFQEQGISIYDAAQAIRLLGSAELGFNIGVIDLTVNLEVEISW